MRGRGTWAFGIAGLLLGVLSRVEEIVPGFTAGISSDGAWMLAAFVAGACSPVAGGVRPAAAGALVLTAANGGYYLWIVVLQPRLDPAAVAGPPGRWLLLGLVGGALFGLAGGVWHRQPRWRAAAALLPTGVLIADGAEAVRGGPPWPLIGLAAGVALALASAPSGPRRWRQAAACGALVAVASTGVLEPLLP
ncbi:DUF6518 family protein [Patulibacter defluvii]|uniref:DUF6518 family protein n=1 Tax=Patulibacter defluvii TaxID=3095358 RepID=UPI002A748BB6|nr:DUF6518 family protein [Patulibacter sp. DM4]